MPGSDAFRKETRVCSQRPLRRHDCHSSHQVAEALRSWPRIRRPRSGRGHPDRQPCPASSIYCSDEGTRHGAFAMIHSSDDRQRSAFSEGQIRPLVACRVFRAVPFMLGGSTERAGSSGDLDEPGHSVTRFPRRRQRLDQACLAGERDLQACVAEPEGQSSPEICWLGGSGRNQLACPLGSSLTPI